jgi:hypothetical protein
MIIDIVIVFIITAIALVASRFLPNKEAIQNNQTESYKSKVMLIYGAGFGSIIVGVLLLVFYAIDEEYQLIINLGKIAFLMLIGIALVNKNFRTSKEIAAYGGMAPVTSASFGGPMPGQVATPTTVAGVTPVQTQVVPVQTVQPQMAAQQVGIKGVQQAPVQTQMVAAQPQPVQQPRIIVIKCPKCQGAMQINTAMLGQKMKCPHCGIEGRIG